MSADTASNLLIALLVILVVAVYRRVGVRLRISLPLARPCGRNSASVLPHWSRELCVRLR